MGLGRGVSLGLGMGLGLQRGSRGSRPAAWVSAYGVGFVGLGLQHCLRGRPRRGSRLLLSFGVSVVLGCCWWFSIVVEFWSLDGSRLLLRREK